ncbi:MAG TPA: LPS export ABC transporter periplasmic protein LptC [Campylobacteraceae bacterium]|nr:LPS export ABC transporter periplasmic protein LptC [Campylobacteraceae bacterium]
MVLKIFAVVILLLVMEITFLSTQEPITLEIKQSNILFSDVTFEALHAYLITTEGLRADLRARRAETFKTRHELEEINATLFFSDHKDYIRADRGLYAPKTLHLLQDIVYDSNHSLLFKSDDLVYNMQNGIAHSDLPFTLLKDGAQAEGTSLRYDTRRRHVTAENIVFTIEEEK